MMGPPLRCKLPSEKSFQTFLKYGKHKQCERFNEYFNLIAYGGLVQVMIKNSKQDINIMIDGILDKFLEK